MWGRGLARSEYLLQECVRVAGQEDLDRVVAGDGVGSAGVVTEVSVKTWSTHLGGRPGPTLLLPYKIIVASRETVWTRLHQILMNLYLFCCSSGSYIHY